MAVKQLSHRVAAKLLPNTPPLNTPAAVDTFAPRLTSFLGLTPADVLILTLADGTKCRYDYQGENLASKPQPPVLRQAGSLASAVGRTVKSAVTRRSVRVPKAVFDERKAVCASCPRWDEAGDRCTVCGCSTQRKLSFSAEQCPHPDGPRWRAWEPGS